MSDYVYCGFWRRFGAYAVDCILLSIIVSGIVTYFKLSDDYAFVIILFIILYWALFESSKMQATIGQRIFNIRIINKDGTSIGFLKSYFRFSSLWIVGFIMGIIIDMYWGEPIEDDSAAGIIVVFGGLIIGIINIFYIALTKENESIPDRIFDTRVVKRNNIDFERNTKTIVEKTILKVNYMSDYVYCDFWRRCGSAFIDGAIQLLITFCLLFCKLKFFYPATPLLVREDYFAYFTTTSNIILITITAMLYYALFESSKLQATPGKYLLNMKIINKQDGTRISFLKSFFRVSLGAVLGMIDNIMNVLIISIINVVLAMASVLCIAFTKEKTSIPDMICSTRVVRR